MNVDEDGYIHRADIATDTPVKRIRPPRIVCTECPANAAVIGMLPDPDPNPYQVMIWVKCHDAGKIVTITCQAYRDAAMNDKRLILDQLKVVPENDLARGRDTFHSRAITELQYIAAINHYLRTVGSILMDAPAAEWFEPAADALREGNIELAIRSLATEAPEVFAKVVAEMPKK